MTPSITCGQVLSRATDFAAWKQGILTSKETSKETFNGQMAASPISDSGAMVMRQQG